MKIFLSSTCYNLTDLRAEIEKFLVNKGHSLLLSDRNNFPVNPGIHRHDVCINNVGDCDLFILVIDSRYGAEYYKDKNVSITWAELKEAIRTKRQTIAFVRREIFNERQTCRHNQKLGLEFVPFFADNVKIFDIIELIQKDELGIWMQAFDNSINVKETLENIYATKHSFLNPIEAKFEISANNIPLNEFSGSTASFITTNYEIDDSKNISVEILQSAIEKIPESINTISKISNLESIPSYYNEYFYSIPVQSGSNSEILMGISPTALGHSVRNELKGALKKIEAEKNAESLFLDTVKRKPILCRLCEFESKSFIIGFYEKSSGLMGKTQHICVLYLFANTWQIYFDHLLDEDECMPKLSSDISIITHDKNAYVYFERIIHHFGTAYNGLGFAEFVLFDFETKTINKLLYSGKYRNEALEGNFDFCLLDQNPNSKIYKFILEQEASKSKYIYRTPTDYNIDDPMNFIEKWNVENPDFYDYEHGVVNLFFYDDVIFWDVDSYGSMAAYKASTNYIENENYLIFYYFAGPILAMRKADSKYFVILVPKGYGAGGSWGIRSISMIVFKAHDIILAQNDYEKYEFNLSTSEYIIKQIETDKMVKNRLKNIGVK